MVRRLAQHRPIEVLVESASPLWRKRYAQAGVPLHEMPGPTSSSMAYWGAFPAYFYFFAGVLFAKNRGRGIDFDRALVPYALGQLATLPLFAFERKLNLAMQTVICRRKKTDAGRTQR